MACKLHYFSQDIREEKTAIPFYSHKCYELVYYINGSGSTTIANEKYNYQGGTCAVILPNVPHDEKRNDKTLLSFIGFSTSNQNILKNGLVTDNSGVILKLFNKIKDEYFSKNQNYDIYINSLCEQICVEISRIQYSSSSSLDKIDYAKNYIDEYFSDSISLYDLAKISGYSYHHFRHLFKDKYSLPPFEYIMNKRMEKAKNLLQNSNLSVSEISQNCGFASSSQFSMLFKKTEKMTPKEFRNK
ncbi:MAG: helix-turn-helix transcriptional regulator [Clostridia bacterium]|nr:helix-turn-helix transcriptional regulator [Clostridia bacterium]